MNFVINNTCERVCFSKVRSKQKQAHSTSFLHFLAGGIHLFIELLSLVRPVCDQLTYLNKNVSSRIIKHNIVFLRHNERSASVSKSNLLCISLARHKSTCLNC